VLRAVGEIGDGEMGERSAEDDIDIVGPTGEGRLRESEGLLDCGVAAAEVEMERESLGFMDREASILTDLVMEVAEDRLD